MNIDKIIGDLGKAMDRVLSAVEETTGFRFRTVEPSPGDIFDLYTGENTVERFSYLSTDKIIPLYKIENGKYVHFTAYSDQFQETVAWEDVLESADQSDYDDIHIKVVLSPGSTSVSKFDRTINTLSDWASKADNPKDSASILGLIENLRRI